MNENQKDRLLKLAENNPELAKDVVEILKEEKHASSAPKEPVAVTIVKPEEEKIVITQSQKRAGIWYIVLPFVCVISTIFAAFTLSGDAFGSFMFLMIVFGIITSWIIKYKLAVPTIKQMFNKHCKFEDFPESSNTKKALKNHFKFW